MSDLKINQFPALTDVQVDDNAKLMPLGLATTGALSSATVAQLKAIFSTQKVKYTATGSEGTTLTISAIAGMNVLLIAREGTVIYEVTSAPNSLEFIWDSVNITLGTATGAGERFLILYKHI